jgi:hypothetical protein
MANLTITVDDDVLRRARIRALELRTSVNAILRDHLEAFAGGSETRAQAIVRILTLSRAAGSRRGARQWSRDELHDR